MHLDVCLVYISRFIETSESMGTIKGVKRFMERFLKEKKNTICNIIRWINIWENLWSQNNKRGMSYSTIII